MSAINLKPKDNTYILPVDAVEPSEIFQYIALYNEFQYYDTDPTGVNTNEIINFYFANIISQATPILDQAKTQFTGVLFIGVPSGFNTDVNYSNGQYVSIIKDMITFDFIKQFINYIKCGYQFEVNNVRPIYNTVKYAKAIESTGIEINYTIWI